MTDQPNTKKVIYEDPNSVHAKSAGTHIATMTNGDMYLTFLEDRLKIDESTDGHIDSKLALAAVCTISMTREQAVTLCQNLKDLLGER